MSRLARQVTQSARRSSDGEAPADWVKAGDGTLTLAAANTYTGGTTVNEGTLQLSGSGTLGGVSGATTVAGATLDLGGTTQAQHGGVTLVGRHDPERRRCPRREASPSRRAR